MRTRTSPHADNPSPTHTVTDSWMFAGSIVDLEPDTGYRIELRLVDPDGGDATEEIEARTWREPVEPRRMTVRYVEPGDGGGSGSRSSPFRGRATAVQRAEPGTLFLLRRGDYVKDDCEN